MKKYLTRRGFVQTATAASAALAWLGHRGGPMVQAAEAGKPALLGGTPARKTGWPKWPEWRESWEPDILKILRSGRWGSSGGGGVVGNFEAAYAQLLGAKACLATASGTTALLTALHAVGIDAGDEVITSPYTFIATYNSILMHKALPVFADTDPATLTMNPASIESRITERTRAIVPVHIYGIPCDMDPINAIAKKHNLVVVEDACQAWLAEYHGQKCGTLADLGCFSFQNSKHLPSGEGGAVTGNREELVDRCRSYHDCGRSFGSYRGQGCFTRGSNYRMMHYQAALLIAQLDKLVIETKRRRENADYLTEGLKQIPGIQPVRLPADSRPVWHLYPFRYDADQFHGLSRNKFIQALRAEGIPASGGYHEQYYDGVLDEAIQSRGFTRLFSAERLKAYRDSFQELKGNKQVCETTVGLPQTILLTDRSGMDQVVEAIRKIHAHSEKLAT
jgi:perosamine synthetase